MKIKRQVRLIKTDEGTYYVPRPTSCTLGGPNLDLLFITSASVGLNQSQRAQAPFSGSVWVMRVEEKGVQEASFILDPKHLPNL